MGKVIAKIRIAYKGRVYLPGDEIICTDTDMIEAWKRADSVQCDEEEKKTEKKIKARRVTAEAGIPLDGNAADGLIGKVPKSRGG